MESFGNDDDLTNGARTGIFQSGRGFRYPQPPPPPPAPFHQRQTMLSQNSGRPIQLQQLRQMAQRAAPAAAAPRPQVKVIAQSKPVKPKINRTPALRPASASQ